MLSLTTQPIEKNKKMNIAKKKRDDEFYTTMETIENELPYYNDKLEGKVIYMNCDDPNYSNFWIYFKKNFKKLKLKKIIATYIIRNDFITYKTTYDGLNEERTPLKGNGSYDSEECLDILNNEADIVITNPPFSLFISYMKSIFDSKKDFIILGHMLCLTYKSIFEEVKKGNCLPGWNASQSYYFYVDNNKIHKKPVNISFITSFVLDKQEEPKSEVLTIERDDNEGYLVYDRIKDIPKEFNEPIAVPITILNKQYRMNKYEIVKLLDPHINGKKKFKRVVIKMK